MLKFVSSQVCQGRVVSVVDEDYMREREINEMQKAGRLTGR